MKKVLLLLIGTVLLTSCAATFQGYTTNATVVNLEKNNFEVTDRVSASATATYVFGYGGNKKNGLISEAKAKLSKDAKLIGKSRALANEVVDVKVQYILGFIVKYSVTATADVVEFK